MKPEGGWGNTTQVAKLTASIGSSFFGFGLSVAISGNTIVVGTSSQGDEEPNGAYIFVKPAGGWVDMTETAELSMGLSDFGSSVAISGNTIAVGGSGPVYVFVRPKHGWTSTSEPSATLSVMNPIKGADFGYSFAVSGDTVAVGAPVFSYTETGATYVFVKPSGGWTNMTQTATLTQSISSADDYFGAAVAINGSSIAVGAPLYAEPYQNGAAYVFVAAPSGWTDMTETAQLTASPGWVSQVGVSVAITSNKVVAGNPTTDPSHNYQGVAYIFDRPKTGWETTSSSNAQLFALDGLQGDSFGVSVAASGGTIVVGATQQPDAAQGAAYVF